MGISALVRSRGFRNFMSKLYGWGASIVILGALFKINHYTGANEMLLIGLGTEAIIFFFSAFEPPHVEPDWSLVYPELGHMYHEEMGAKAAISSKARPSGSSLTNELDRLLEEAKVGPELLSSLGEGLRKLSENTNRLGNMSSAAVASDEFINSMKAAANSVEKMAESSKKSAQVFEQDATASQEYIQHVRQASDNLAQLGTIYNQAGNTIKTDLAASKEFADALRLATQSTNELREKYTRSAEHISQSAENIDINKSDTEAYNLQIKKISSNLSALNTAYEMQLQSMQQQVDAGTRIQSSVNQLLGNINQTAENMNKYREEVDALTRKIAALNSVYGNMLTAMNVNIK